VKLDAEDHAAIAAEVVALLREQPLPAVADLGGDVLTREEAKLLVKRSSEGAFCAWCRRWGVHAKIRGRYSRQRLEVALEREARETGRAA
jgi:hypothetical protein